MADTDKPPASVHEYLKIQARAGIENLIGDTTVGKQQTYEDLMELAERIDEAIDLLSQELEEEEK